MYKLRSRLRNALAAVALLGLAACAGKGCSCVQPIKGGFPVDQRRENAIQIRATQSLFQYLTDNGAQIIPALLPGGTTFTVPPSCSGNKICCSMPNQVCQIKLGPQKLNLAPQQPNNVHLVFTTKLNTVMPLPVEFDTGIVGTAKCLVTLNTDAGTAGRTDIDILGDLNFAVEQMTDLTRINLNNADVQGLDASMLDLKSQPGDILCTIANFGPIKSFVVSALVSQLKGQLSGLVNSQLCQSCMTKDDCNSFATACTGGQCMESDGKTCVSSLGIEGNLDVGSLLSSFAPGLKANMDILAVAGGYAAADTGLSLGILGGGLGDPHNSCVPVVPAPPTPAIAQSKTFFTDVLPDNATPYHLGIGIHRTHLDTLGWSAFDSGALCLHVGTPTVALLSSKTIGLIIPSLQDLVHVGNAPMFIALEPSLPPTFTLGKGTFKTDAQGRTVVDDPLLHVHIPQFAIDFFAWADDRYVRIMTLHADVELPISLEVDGAGKLTPVFGDLTTAFSNVSVTNSDLLAESPDQLAQAFPMLLGIAVGQLTGALSGFSIPALMGLNVKPIAITSTDPGSDGTLSFLSIFANVSAATTPARVHTDTVATLETMQLPTTREFAVGARGTTVPAAVLQLDGRGPGALEYAWSVDGGPWSAYTETSRAIVSDPQFWMQGRHTIDVRSRAVGRPDTTDPTPARVDVIVDTVAPTGGFDLAGNEIRIDASDAVSPAEAIQFRFAVAGNAFGPWIASDHASLPVALDAGSIHVQARDEAGNVGDLGFHGRSTAPSAAGCNCAIAGRGADSGETGGALLFFATAGVLFFARRRRVWLRRLAIAGGAALLALGVLATGGCSHNLGKGDYENPLDEVGRYSDVVFKNGTLYVSAYDDSMGDLAYAEIKDPSKPIGWQVVDGVDLTEPADTKGGYRGGISDPGPDVGQYTSIALVSGHPMIAYFDVSNGALKFARGPHPFDVMTVDQGDTTAVDVGMYAAISADNDGVPTIAYVASGMASGDHFTSELRVAVASNDHPSSPSDWSISTVDSTQISCAGRCSGGSACIVPAMVNNMPNVDPSKSTCVSPDAAPCAATCTATQACIMGACTNVLQPPGAPDLFEGTGLFVNARRNSQGQLVLVYYDHAQGDLKMATGSPGSWQVSFIDGNDPTTDVGQFATVELGSDDSVHVAYVDAISDRLLYKHVAGGSVPGTPDVIDDGARADGPHSVGAGANLALDGNGAPRVVYQDQQLSDLEVATNAGAWSHMDLETGIPGYGFYPHQLFVDGKLYMTEFVYDRQNGPGATLGTFQVSVSAP
ncbi:MAG TPA: hypothetical protein VN947_24190 [Polyangia bacterium]|nr:hypothetical protein [Polyangia bacterium]